MKKKPTYLHCHVVSLKIVYQVATFIYQNSKYFGIDKLQLERYAQCIIVSLIIGLELDSSTWAMVRGKDYVGNLSEIQERFCYGKYKGGAAEKIGKL